MSDTLHERLVAALNRAAEHPWHLCSSDLAARVAADRRVLARHDCKPGEDYDWCGWCCESNGEDMPWPCPDVRDLAARYGVEVTP